MSKKTWENFKSGFIKENPVFTLYLGMCSTLAISTSLNNAIGMGVTVIIVLVLSNTIISLMRKIIPNEIRIPVYIVIISTLVKSMELFIKAYAPTLNTALGVFIPLIVVNCIILGRAEAFASKHKVLESALDGLGMGMGYTFSLLLISLVRQIIGTGVLSMSNPFTEAVIFQVTIIPSAYIIPVFAQSTGAFMTFALLAAGFAAINAKRTAKEAK